MSINIWLEAGNQGGVLQNGAGLVVVVVFIYCLFFMAGEHSILIH